MKIAIITGHFMPEIGYQETYLARALSKLEHEVCVFTSNKISPSKKKLVNLKTYKTGVFTDKKYFFNIIRLTSTLSLGSMVISAGLRRSVLLFKPDLIIVLGIGKIFPISIFDLNKSLSCKVIALMGNNKDYYSWGTLSAKLNSIKNLVTLKLLKKWIYRRAVKFSDKIFVYTNDTEKILRSLLSEKLKAELTKKISKTTLGFDPDEFYFNEDDYLKVRDKYNIPFSSVVVVTSTRVNKDKKLEQIIDSVSELQNESIDLYYIIIGFMAGEYEKELKKYIKSKEQDNKFICLPFLDHEKIRQIYCASDIGIWMQAAISIQESMGTGLKVVLEEKGSVNHLIKQDQNGWYFKQGELDKVLRKILINGIKTNPNHKIIEKKKTEIYNRQIFSYIEISKELLNITFHTNKQ